MPYRICIVSDTHIVYVHHSLLSSLIWKDVLFCHFLYQGFPNDGAAECVDSYKHMSVIVVLNSVELLVDLMRFPGQLLPRSTKSILMTHISAAGESDSAENDSCDSPLEPNSPLYGVSERLDPKRFGKWLLFVLTQLHFCLLLLLLNLIVL